MNGIRILEGLEGRAPSDFTSPVVTLGTFDGVHLGHRAVVGAMVDWADALGGEPMVLTFRRHPRLVLSGEGPARIISFKERVSRLQALGVRTLLDIGFTPEIASTPAAAFVRDVLAGRFGIRGVVLGFGASFGKGKEGNAALLKAMAPELGFEVREVPPVLVDGRAVSSSAIRERIRAGDVGGANRLLGGFVLLSGRVVKGRGRGRDVGFRTANLALDHEVYPPPGVYTGAVHVGGRDRVAVISIGHAPTLGAGLPEAVEVHVPELDEDLYGEALRVRVTGRIRDQKRFDSVEALAEAIHADIETARLAFSDSVTES
ncbi:MAG: riboflavin biosynthesis protein RibF [Planctomycetota bacterium]